MQFVLAEDRSVVALRDIRQRERDTWETENTDDHFDI